ncbi:hypothetical protein APA_680 [Pseudanabaena sp. lw0831]|nr:hypothetical protein APA_680 [Pseudanabaena sp. lw0831]
MHSRNFFSNYKTQSSLTIQALNFIRKIYNPLPIAKNADQ